MSGFERVVEWLRPLVDIKAWDYCVVWKLGDDPSRFIEWMGCCCSGGIGGVNVKVERGEEQHLSPICRDTHYQHPLRTKACEALAHFPSFMPLYSGVHGEVVISNQPRWLIHTNDSNPSHESTGTQVLIPVFGGLIELFAAKHIPEDQQIIELVTANCNVPLKHESMTAQSYTNVSVNEQPLDPLLEESSQNLVPPLQLLSFIPRLQVPIPVTHFNALPNFEGSSSCSSPLNEHPPLDSHSGYVSPNVPLKKSFGRPCLSRRPKHYENVSKPKQGLLKAAKDNAKVIQRPDRGQCQSKNLLTERNRRNKIKDGLFSLRALVPKITKMDRASILGDAMEYIGDLQKQVKELQDELREIEEEDCKKNNAELNFSKLGWAHQGKRYLPPPEQNKGSLDNCKKIKKEVHVEVNQIGKREFFINLVCEERRGGFARLMEDINSIGLQVVDANITTFSGRVLNILRVEANKDIQPKKLTDILIELAG